MHCCAVIVALSAGSAAHYFAVLFYVLPKRL
jgi:hypothetical protein